MGSHTTHTWSDLPKQLEATIPASSKLLARDAQYKAFADTPSITSPFTFGIKAAGSDSSVLVTVGNGIGKVTTGDYKNALFTLSALPEQWEEFFKPVPVSPYQSYWGMFGMNIKQKGRSQCRNFENVLRQKQELRFLGIRTHSTSTPTSGDELLKFSTMQDVGQLKRTLSQKPTKTILLAVTSTSRLPSGVDARSSTNKVEMDLKTSSSSIPPVLTVANTMRS